MTSEQRPLALGNIQSLPGGASRLAQGSSTGELKTRDHYFNARLTILLHEGWAKVLEDPAFVKYLEYLRYWEQPQ